MPPLTLPVEMTLDKRSATTVANDAQQAMAEAGRNISRDFSRSMSGINGGDHGRRIGRETSAALRTEMRSGLSDVVGDFTRQFGAMGDVAGSAFAAMPRGAGIAAAGVAGVGLAAVAVGKQLYDLGAQWDDIADGITGRTGKIGSELTAITDVVKDLGAVTAVPLASLGDIAGQVSQSLNLTGQPLQDMTQTLAELTQLGRNVDIRGLGKAFQIFDVTDSRSQIDMLNELNSASQTTGIDINQLIASLRDSGKTASQFGLSMGQAAGLLATLDEAGVDVTKTSASLSIALKNLAKDGRDPAEGLRDTVSEIKRLHDAGQETDAVTLAVKNLGRGYADLLGPIEKGTLSAESLDKALSGNNADIHTQAQSVGDLSEEWTKLSNTLSTVFEPAASWVFSQVNENLQKDIIKPLQDLIALAHGVDMPQGPSGPLPPGYKPGDPLGALSGARPPAPGAPAAPPDPGAPGFGLNAAGQDVWGWGRPPGWATGPGSGTPKSSSAAKLPDAPVLPFDTSLPSGLANLPQTAALYSAESSFLDARHKSAEKQARLNQLEQSNVATEADRLAARNDLIQAQRSQSEAEARMYDTATKKVKDQTGQMEQIGAQLDNDFGVSKGLAGIADNITRFLANLAFAPVLGALQAVKTSEGFDSSKQGSGLMGMLGSSGALGPRFMPSADGQSTAASPYVMGPGGVTPGMGLPGGGGQPYGLPAGSNSGGYGGGGVQFPAWVNQMAAAFGIKPSTYGGHQESDRHEAGYAPNPNHENRGIDWSGPTENLQRFADYLTTIPGTLEQAIWENPTTHSKTGIAGGQIDPGYYPQSTYDEHGGNDPKNIHVHTRQSQSLPAPSGGGAPGGAPQWNADWNAIAQGESGGNWGINTGNGYSGGLQFSPSSWQAAGGGQYAPSANQASPYQQAMTAEQLLAMQGPGAWPNTFVPGSTGPSAPGALPPLGSPGFGGGGGGPGMGMPQGLGFGGMPLGLGSGLGGPLGNAGAAPSSSVAGGRTFGQGTPASGGLSFSGGIIGAAASMAGSAGSFGAGGGAAADLGMKLIGRAIGAGGQYVGNAVGGAMETFMLNDSALGDPGKSWLGKLAIAGAGARPALPNSAGALGGEQNAAMAEGGKPPAAPLTPEQAKAKEAEGGGAGNAAAKQGDTNTYNTTVNNSRATEDGTGRDVQAALGATQASKQPR